MSFWHSLTSRLFRQVFGWYLTLAVCVTAVQLGLEYAAVHRAIGRDLESLGRSFSLSAADALWSFDRAQLAAMANGIVQTGFVTGTIIESTRGDIAIAAGLIPAAGHPAEDGLLAPYQHRRIPLLQQTPRGERKPVGTLLLFSDRSVAVERVEYSFVVILVNSLIKTAGLWLILYLAMRRLLARPLVRLTDAVSRPGFVEEIGELVPLEGTHDDELGHLAAALRRMQERLAESRKILENVNQSLEQMVTERTADLRESEAKLRGLYELSPLGIALTDMAGRYVEFNESFRRICGYSEEELKALDYWRLTPDQYRQDEARQLESLERTGRYGPYEKEYVRKDGSRVPLRLNGVLVTGKDGNRYIWSIVEDITATRQAEARLRLAASVFDNAHEALCITDAEERIVDVNPVFTELTGFARDEALGKTPRILKSGDQPREFYVAMWQAIDRDGHWQGELWNRRPDGQLYAVRLTVSSVRDERGGVSHYVGILSDITAIKEQTRRLERAAHYDALTGVPNRVLLGDRLRQAVAQSCRNQSLLAVCYLDLDGFKDINDAHGHEAGDRVLAEMANRLHGNLRGGDTVARMGGDEFVLLLVGLGSVAECEAVLQRVLVDLSRPVALGGFSVALSVSIGAAFCPRDATDAGQLLHDADVAMYRAKQEGKNRYCLSGG